MANEETITFTFQLTPSQAIKFQESLNWAIEEIYERNHRLGRKKHYLNCVTVLAALEDQLEEQEIIKEEERYT